MSDAESTDLTESMGNKYNKIVTEWLDNMILPLIQGYDGADCAMKDETDGAAVDAKIANQAMCVELGQGDCRVNTVGNYNCSNKSTTLYVIAFVSVIFTLIWLWQTKRFWADTVSKLGGERVGLYKGAAVLASAAGALSNTGERVFTGLFDTNWIISDSRNRLFGSKLVILILGIFGFLFIGRLTNFITKHAVSNYTCPSTAEYLCTVGTELKDDLEEGHTCEDEHGVPRPCEVKDCCNTIIDDSQCNGDNIQWDQEIYKMVSTDPTDVNKKLVNMVPGTDIIFTQGIACRAPTFRMKASRPTCANTTGSSATNCEFDDGDTTATGCTTEGCTYSEGIGGGLQYPITAHCRSDPDVPGAPVIEFSGCGTDMTHLDTYIQGNQGCLLPSDITGYTFPGVLRPTGTTNDVTNNRSYERHADRTIITHGTSDKTMNNIECNIIAGYSPDATNITGSCQSNADSRITLDGCTQNKCTIPQSSGNFDSSNMVSYIEQAIATTDPNILDPSAYTGNYGGPNAWPTSNKLYDGLDTTRPNYSVNNVNPAGLSCSNGHCSDSLGAPVQVGNRDISSEGECLRNNASNVWNVGACSDATILSEVLCVAAGPGVTWTHAETPHVKSCTNVGDPLVYSGCT